MDIGYDSVSTDAIGRIEGNEFEDFCKELISFERHERHRGSKLDGPSPKSAKDGGRDLLLRTTRRPTPDKESFIESLTEDHLGETCFSCKTGEGWRRGVLADAKTATRPLQVLAGGGHYTLLVNRRVDKDAKSTFKKKATTTRGEPRTLLEHVAGYLFDRLKTEAGGGLTLTDLIQRVHLYDANDLCEFLKHHAPTISALFKEKLGIGDVPGVIPIEQWIVDHKSERALPEFCVDAARSQYLEQIRGVLRARSSEPRRQVIWIHGPPGVGKTRLALEAMRGLPRFVEEIQRRVFVALDYERGMKAIDEHDLFRRHRDAILIVDECSPDEHAPDEDDINRIVSKFERRRRGERGALVLIGPLPRPKRPNRLGIIEILLEPLPESSCRELIAAEMQAQRGAPLPVIDRVLYLSEGYPWFAVLLAHAVQADPGALPEGADRWNAAELALAPRQPARETSAWKGEVWLRAQALLLALLTEDTDWRRLPEATQKSYRRAVAAPSWSKLMRAAESCRDRGLLRLRQDWKYKYVSPLNLAREVAIKLLGAPHWYGRPIREHAPALLPRIFEKLSKLDVPKNIIEALAGAELDDLSRGPPSLDALARGDPSVGILSFVARHQPARAAALLRRLVEGTSLDGLREREDVRRDLVFALEELSRRKVSFIDAEAALFRLALAENEAWLNSATGVWSSLFFGELNATHWTFLERLEILRGRLAAQAPEERLLALAGLSTVLSTEQLRLGGSEVDGASSAPTPAEARSVRRAGWELLSHSSCDADPDVAQRARGIAIAHVRDAVRDTDGAPGLLSLAQVAPAWSEPELRRLRAEIDDAEGYERDWLKTDPAARSALAELQRAVAPSSYSQRLREAVGHFWLRRRRLTGDALRELHEEMDRALAKEGLAASSLLLGELDWLGSEEARRATAFMAQVGRIDAGRILLPALVERARSGGPRHLLSGYLLGLVAGGESEQVNVWLREWRQDRRLVRSVLDAIWRIGLTQERIEWIVDDLENGRIEPSDVGALTLAQWSSDTGPKAARSLIATIAEQEGVTAQITALTLMLDRIKADGSELGPLRPSLAAVVGRLAREAALGSMERYAWEQGALLLLRAGDERAALEAAAEALSRAGDMGRDEHAWSILFACLEEDPVGVWWTLALVLEGPSRVASRIVIEAERNGILAHLPVPEVMAWVGRDLTRSRLVARMCPVHQASLGAIARELLIRFGPQSLAGSVLASRVHSTPRAVSSVARFYKAQLKHARAWSRDPHPRVAAWAKDRMADLQRSYESSDAQEEYERRRWGT